MRLPRITYQNDVCPRPGEFVVPQGPRARTAYLVLTAREVKARVPRAFNVWMLEVERVSRDTVPGDATKHPLFWFSRDRKPRPGERGVP